MSSGRFRFLPYPGNSYPVHGHTGPSMLPMFFLRAAQCVNSLAFVSLLLVLVDDSNIFCPCNVHIASLLIV